VDRLDHVDGDHHVGAALLRLDAVRTALRRKSVELERLAVHLVLRIPVDVLGGKEPLALLLLELPVLQPREPARNRIGELPPEDLDDVVEVDEERAFDLAADHADRSGSGVVRRSLNQNARWRATPPAPARADGAPVARCAHGATAKRQAREKALRDRDFELDA